MSFFGIMLWLLLFMLLMLGGVCLSLCFKAAQREQLIIHEPVKIEPPLQEWPRFPTPGE